MSPERDVLALGLLSALRKGGRATAWTTALRGAHRLHRMGMCRKWAGLVAVEAVAVMAAVNFGCFFEGVFGVFRSGGSGVVVPMDLHCFWVKPQRPSGRTDPR